MFGQKEHLNKLTLIWLRNEMHLSFLIYLNKIYSKSRNGSKHLNLIMTQKMFSHPKNRFLLFTKKNPLNCEINFKKKCE